MIKARREENAKDWEDERIMINVAIEFYWYLLILKNE